MTDRYQLLGVAEICKLAGTRSTPISRNTLKVWRETRGFPLPVATLDCGEIWDREEVRLWLKDAKAWRRKRRKRRTP